MREMGHRESYQFTVYGQIITGGSPSFLLCQVNESPWCVFTCNATISPEPDCAGAYSASINMQQMFCARSFLRSNSICMAACNEAVLMGCKFRQSG